MISPVAKPLCIWGLKTRFRFEGEETVTGDPRRHRPVVSEHLPPSRPFAAFVPFLAGREQAEGNKLTPLL